MAKKDDYSINLKLKLATELKKLNPKELNDSQRQIITLTNKYKELEEEIKNYNDSISKLKTPKDSTKKQKEKVSNVRKNLRKEINTRKKQQEKIAKELYDDEQKKQQKLSDATKRTQNLHKKRGTQDRVSGMADKKIVKEATYSKPDSRVQKPLFPEKVKPSKVSKVPSKKVQEETKKVEKKKQKTQQKTTKQIDNIKKAAEIKSAKYNASNIFSPKQQKISDFAPKLNPYEGIIRDLNSADNVTKVSKDYTKNAVEKQRKIDAQLEKERLARIAKLGPTQAGGRYSTGFDDTQMPVGRPMTALPKPMDANVEKLGMAAKNTAISLEDLIKSVRTFKDLRKLEAKGIKAGGERITRPDVEKNYNIKDLDELAREAPEGILRKIGTGKMPIGEYMANKMPPEKLTHPTVVGEELETTSGFGESPNLPPALREIQELTKFKEFKGPDAMANLTEESTRLQNILSKNGLGDMFDNVEPKIKMTKDGFVRLNTSIEFSNKLMNQLTAGTNKRLPQLQLFAQQFAKLGKKTGEFFQKVQHYITFSIGVTAVMQLRQSFQDLIQTYEDYEKAVINTTTISGYLGGSFDDAVSSVDNLARVLSSNTIYSIIEVANAMYDLASAGYDVTEMTERDLMPILNYAAATQSDLKEATYSVMTTIKQFNLELEDSARIVDTYVSSITSSFTTMDKLREAMKYVGSIAGILGVEFEEATAGVTVLADQGMEGCYDEKTRVYTDKGFKFFKDLDGTEKFLTINLETDEYEWQSSTEYFEYKNTRPLYRVKNKHIDLAVTDNHNMVVKKSTDDKYKLHQAKDIYGKDVRYKLISNWKGEEVDRFILPSVVSNFSTYEKLHEEKEIDMKLWTKFMAVYLSEGHYTLDNNSNYKVVISQKKNNKCYEDIVSILNELNYNYNYSNGQFTILDKQLYTYLKQFGRSSDKYIPEYILSLPREYLEEFYRLYNLCDGDKKGNIYTSSIKMRDCVVELLLKIGKAPSFNIKNKKGHISTIKGREVKTKYDNWIIHTNNHQLNPRFYRKDYTNFHKERFEDSFGKSIIEDWEEYNGNVYCVTVPNHTLIVERNGKIVICGNSQAGQRLNMVFTKLLKPTDKAKTMLEDMGLTMKDLNPDTSSLVEILYKLQAANFGAAEAATMFRARTAGAAAVLVDQADKLAYLTQQYQMAAGITEAVALKQQESFSASLKMLKDDIAAAMSESGEGFSQLVLYFKELALGAIRVGNFIGKMFPTDMSKKFISTMLVALTIFTVGRRMAASYAATQANLALITALQTKTTTKNTGSWFQNIAAKFRGVKADASKSASESGLAGKTNQTTLAIEQQNSSLQKNNMLKSAGNIQNTTGAVGKLAGAFSKLGGVLQIAIMGISLLPFILDVFKDSAAEASNEIKLFNKYASNTAKVFNSINKGEKGNWLEIGGLKLAKKSDAEIMSDILSGKELYGLGEESATKVRNGFNDYIKDNNIDLSTMFPEQDSIPEDISEWFIGSVVPVLGQFQQGVTEGLLEGASDEFKQVLADYKASLDELSDSEMDFFVAHDALSQIGAEVEIAIFDMGKAYEGLITAQDNANNSNMDNIKTQKELIEAQNNFNDSQLVYNKAIGQVLSTLRKIPGNLDFYIAKLEEGSEATRELTIKQRDLDRNMRQVSESADELAYSISEYGASSNEALDAQDDLLNLLEDQVDIEKEISDLEIVRADNTGVISNAIKGQFVSVQELMESTAEYKEIEKDLNETEIEFLDYAQDIITARDGLVTALTDQTKYQALVNVQEGIQSNNLKYLLPQLREFYEAEDKLYDVEYKLYKLRNDEDDQLDSLFKKLAEQGLLNKDIIDNYKDMKKGEGDVLKLNKKFVDTYGDLSQAEKDIVDQYMKGDLDESALLGIEGADTIIAYKQAMDSFEGTVDSLKDALMPLLDSLTDMGAVTSQTAQMFYDLLDNSFESAAGQLDLSDAFDEVYEQFTGVLSSTAMIADALIDEEGETIADIFSEMMSNIGVDMDNTEMVEALNDFFNIDANSFQEIFEMEGGEDMLNLGATLLRLLDDLGLYEDGMSLTAAAQALNLSESSDYNSVLNLLMGTLNSVTDGTSTYYQNQQDLEEATEDVNTSIDTLNSTLGNLYNTVGLDITDNFVAGMDLSLIGAIDSADILYEKIKDIYALLLKGDGIGAVNIMAEMGQETLFNEFDKTGPEADIAKKFNLILEGISVSENETMASAGITSLDAIEAMLIRVGNVDLASKINEFQASMHTALITPTNVMTNGLSTAFANQFTGMSIASSNFQTAVEESGTNTGTSINDAGTNFFDLVDPVAVAFGSLLGPIGTLISAAGSAALNANGSATTADTATDNANTATTNANTAGDRANSIADRVGSWWSGVKSWLGGIKFASGGVVKKPTFGMFGEAGTEAVVPLEGSNKKYGRGILQDIIPNYFPEMMNSSGGIYGGVSSGKFNIESLMKLIKMMKNLEKVMINFQKINEEQLLNKMPNIDKIPKEINSKLPSRDIPKSIRSPYEDKYLADIGRYRRNMDYTTNTSGDTNNVEEYNINGPITVISDSPNDFAGQLKYKYRSSR